MPTVELNGVSKRYGREGRAVDGVTLGIRDGELLVLVGPSGCGKSTLLRMIAGLESVTEGEIRIGTRVVNEVPPRDRDIAMVFQNYALYPHMSVFENLAFGLRRRKVAEPEVARRVSEAAATLGLEGYLERKPRELSGGERQRVALGRALVRQPQVFLFDEPLSNLDARLRVQMRAEIKRLHRRVGATMIYVTHDQVEAMTLGERIAVLRGGVLQQVADPATLYRHPANPFVAGFIGSPPINLFEATVAADGGLEAGGVTIALPPQSAALTMSSRGRGVTVGVRPEDVHRAIAGEPIRFEGEVEGVEPLGNEVIVYWNTAVGTLVSRHAGQSSPAVGERAALSFEAGKLHLFDSATGHALAGAAPPG